MRRSNRMARVLGGLLLLATVADGRAAIGFTGDGWYRWDVAAGPTAIRACCFGAYANQPARAACRPGDSGSTECDAESDALSIYVRVDDGQVREIRPQSGACPATVSDQVTRLAGISTRESIDWLTATLDRAPRLADDAIMAIALHEDAAAVAALRGLLEDRRRGRELREQVLFWLVQSDSELAYSYLARLLDAP